MIKDFKSKFELFNCIGHSSSDTHKLKPMYQLFSFCTTKLLNEDYLIIDPFSRSCLWADRRNDINPKYLHEFSTHCMDALEFLKNEKSSSVDILLLDPPFSDRQSDEEYGTNNLYANPKYMSDLGKQIFRIIKPGRYVLKCGFNSNPPSFDHNIPPDWDLWRSLDIYGSET